LLESDRPRHDRRADLGTRSCTHAGPAADLRRWKWEVGQFFDGVGPDCTDEELQAIAPNHPVFEIHRT
jgi:hypothetical protein